MNIVFTVDENNCFNVVSHKPDYFGYFHFWKHGSRYKMHRFIFEECFGPIPKGKCIMHICDNTRCINPEHLKIGTNRENQLDKCMKNRQAKGEKHGMHKLTKKKVVQILKSKDNSKIESKKHGVCPSMVRKIRQGKYWRHLDV